MVDKTTPFRPNLRLSKPESLPASLKEALGDTLAKLGEEANQIVEGLDLKAMAERIETFGREKPLALALAAVTVGMAAGVLMRRTT